MSACALHTVIGRNSRQRKGLEPSRRLSETTGPQSPSGFRIAFQATEVTNRAAHGASTKHRVSYAAQRRLGVTASHGVGCTCYRGSSRAGSPVTTDSRGAVKFPVPKAIQSPFTLVTAPHRACSWAATSSTTDRGCGSPKTQPQMGRDRRTRRRRYKSAARLQYGTVHALTRARSSEASGHAVAVRAVRTRVPRRHHLGTAP